MIFVGIFSAEINVESMVQGNDKDILDEI